MLDFGSQVNIMTRDTWEQMGRPRLYESGIYLKLAKQALIEPIRVYKNVDTTIKGILTKVDFEIINPKEGSNSFPALVGQPWGRKMKASISLDKERIKLKGNGQKVIVPIHPFQGVNIQKRFTTSSTPLHGSFVHFPTIFPSKTHKTI